MNRSCDSYTLVLDVPMVEHINLIPREVPAEVGSANPHTAVTDNNTITGNAAEMANRMSVEELGNDEDGSSATRKQGRRRTSLRSKWTVVANAPPTFMPRRRR